MRPTALVFGVMLAITSPALVIAATPEHPMGDMKHSAAPATMQEHAGSAKVMAVNKTGLTLAHGPIATKGWPAMTMMFQLARPELAAGIKKGDAVQFRFMEKDGAAIVTFLAKDPP